MFEPLRIALVAEGVTDYEMLRAAIDSMLAGRSFDLKLLQPEGSVAFIGGGWRGVYKWCLQLVERGGGRLSGDPLFDGYDLLLIHLDADVAGEDPANYPVNPMPEVAGVLPCEEPCPPARATTGNLRQVLLAWIGESRVPARTVVCTPSKNIEAWVMAVFFPNDRDMKRKGWECHPDPEVRLRQQPKGKRFAKSWAEYRERQSDLREAWPSVVVRLPEARRFQEDFIEALRLRQS